MSVAPPALLVRPLVMLLLNILSKWSQGIKFGNVPGFSCSSLACCPGGFHLQTGICGGRLLCGLENVLLGVFVVCFFHCVEVLFEACQDCVTDFSYINVVA